MLKALVAGVSVSLILQVLVTKGAGYAWECCFDAQAAPPLWYAIIFSPLGAVASLLPGFVAGWLNPRHGIAAGFLTGLVGNIIYSAIFLTTWSTVMDSGTLPFLDMIVRLLFLASSWALSNAASGGTAQLLRSHNRLHAVGRKDAASS